MNLAGRNFEAFEFVNSLATFHLIHYCRDVFLTRAIGTDHSMKNEPLTVFNSERMNGFIRSLRESEYEGIERERSDCVREANPAVRGRSVPAQQNKLSLFTFRYKAAMMRHISTKAF